MNDRHEWDRAYPPTPSQYHSAMMRTLNDMEEISMKRRHKATLTLVAALVALIAMSAVALAAMNHWGILDFFGRGEDALKPMGGIEELIESDLGSAENAFVRLTIREAMYDGFGLRVVAAVEPVDKGKYVVVDDIETPVPGGLLPIVLDGATITSDNAQLDDGEIWVPGDQFEMEDGVLILSAEGILNGDAPDVIHLNYALRGEGEQAGLSVSFDLQNRATPRAVKLTPREQGEDYRIVSAEIKYTQLAAYLDVVFEDQLPTPQGEPFDVPEGIYYGTPGALYFHSDPNCSGMENVQAHELSEFLENGSRACPFCMDAPRAPAARVMYFAILDADGTEIATQGGGSSQVGDEMNGVRTYHQISTFQTSEALPDKVFLQPMVGSEKVGTSTIACDVIK